MPAGTLNDRVVEALAPGDNVAELAGENDSVQPLGTVDVRLKVEAAHPQLLLLRTVTVYFNWLVAVSEIVGAWMSQGGPDTLTRIIAPSTLVESVCTLMPIASSENTWPTSSVESKVVVEGERST